jgi:mRNA interferase MazF
MPFEFGDVVLVPFPFTSQRASKKRPAVVVGNRAYNTTRPDRIVMAITSQLRPESGYGRRTDQQLASGRVARRLGALDDDDRAALRKAISEIIG